MSLSLTLTGSDRIAYLDRRSLRIVRTVDGSQGVADYTLRQITASLGAGTSVVIADGATTYFDGTVRSIDAEYINGASAATRQTHHCQDDAVADGSSPAAPFALSATPNGTTKFGFQSLSVSVADEPYRLWGQSGAVIKVSTWKAGLSVGEMLSISDLSTTTGTVGDLVDFSTAYRILRMTITWPINATSPLFTLELNRLSPRLEQVFDINAPKTFFPETPYTGQHVFRSDI